MFSFPGQNVIGVLSIYHRGGVGSAVRAALAYVKAVARRLRFLKASMVFAIMFTSNYYVRAKTVSGTFLRKGYDMKVALMESLGISDEELVALEAPLKQQGVEFASYDRTTDKETLIREASDKDVMILANMPMPADVIAACPQLKFIDVAFTGVDHVGLSAAKAAGIAVSNASGYSNEAVPELVIGMVLSWLRNMRAVEDRCRAGKTKQGLVGSELKSKTVGIIGLGNIGSRSAELFHAFGANVIGPDQHWHDSNASYIKKVTMEELLKTSDIVVLHCPLNDSTRGMIGKEQLALMKPTALLVNAARGPVVVTQDLADALNQGTIGGACLDVFDNEPPLDPSMPLLNTPNTLVTPHVAFATKESMTLRAQIVFDNLISWMNGNQKNVIL